MGWLMCVHLVLQGRPPKEKARKGKKHMDLFFFWFPLKTNPTRGFPQKRHTPCLEPRVFQQTTGSLFFFFQPRESQGADHCSYPWYKIASVFVYPPTKHGSAQTRAQRLLSSWKGGLCTSMLVGGRVTVFVAFFKLGKRNYSVFCLARAARAGHQLKATYVKLRNRNPYIIHLNIAL